MSDGFDKEAEREKLREKLADDEEKREHTQRMSELLLQGATMTNRHCDDCGDPIFRKDGQEFCPTCHTVDAADAAGAADAANAVDAADAANAVDATDAADPDPTAAGQPAMSPAGGESRPAAGENGATGAQRADRRPAGTGPEPTPEAPDPSVAEASDSSLGASGSPPTGSEPSAGASGGGTATSTSAGPEGVADARASLVRTLNRFAAAAEETDDPRRARDHLRAAREAAEALAALDR